MAECGTIDVTGDTNEPSTTRETGASASSTTDPNARTETIGHRGIPSRRKRFCCNRVNFPSLLFLVAGNEGRSRPRSKHSLARSDLRRVWPLFSSRKSRRVSFRGGESLCHVSLGRHRLKVNRISPFISSKRGRELVLSFPCK